MCKYFARLLKLFKQSNQYMNIVCFAYCNKIILQKHINYVKNIKICKKDLA